MFSNKLFTPSYTYRYRSNNYNKFNLNNHLIYKKWYNIFVNHISNLFGLLKQKIINIIYTF
jgi:hypothetical protein